jgi:hypothetical protein
VGVGAEVGAEVESAETHCAKCKERGEVWGTTERPIIAIRGSCRRRHLRQTTSVAGSRPTHRSVTRRAEKRQGSHDGAQAPPRLPSGDGN